MEDSAEDSSSSATASKSQLTWAGAREASAGWSGFFWPDRLSIASYVGSCPHCCFCGCVRLGSRRKAACPLCSQPCERVLHTMREDISKEEHGFSPCSHCQKSGAKERARSRSPQWGKDLRSWCVDTTDYDHSAGRRRRRTGPPRRDPLPGMMQLQGPLTAAPSQLLHPVLLGSKPCQCRESRADPHSGAMISAAGLWRSRTTPAQEGGGRG